MKECSKSIMRRLSQPNFVNRYFVGDGIDIGGCPDPLAVESREVIDIQSGSADGLKSFYPGMRSVPIVVV